MISSTWMLEISNQAAVHLFVSLTHIRSIRSTGKKGGALASMVFAFLQTGDQNARALTHRVLQTVCQPIFHIVDRWIYDGELHDPFHEVRLLVEKR